MNDPIDRLPDGNVYTGGKGNVDPKIRGERYRYEEVPTLNTRIQPALNRSDHPPPPPFRPLDPMTSGQLSSPVFGGAQILRLPSNPHKHVPSTGDADRVLHDEPTSGIRRGSTRYLHDSDNICSLAPDVRQRSQVNQPQTKLNHNVNDGYRAPVFTGDRRLDYHPPATHDIRRPQLVSARDLRDVVQASGDRQYQTQSLQGQYRGYQPREVREYQEPDDVNNHRNSSHDHNNPSNDNGDCRGHHRHRNPPLHHPGRRQGS